MQPLNPEYDFSNFVYIDNKTAICVTCHKHGVFTQHPGTLLKGHAQCPECAREERQRVFIEKARKVHGDKYDYSKIYYTNNDPPIENVCPIHGSFWSAPGDHLKGYGCGWCSGKQKHTTESWIKKAQAKWGTRFDYSQVDYKTNKTPITVICRKHGAFKVIPNNHMHGYGGCMQCEAERRHTEYAKTNEQFIEELKKVHGNKYDYSKVNYYNSKTKVTLICPKHGEFESFPGSLLKGGGCPHCTRWVNQESLYQRLVNLFPSEDLRYEHNVKWLGMQRFDIYFPKYNIAVEYDGIQHFEAIAHFGGEEKFLETLRRDKLKEEKCQQNNCTLFRIPYDYTDDDFEDVCSQIEIIVSHKLETSTVRSGLIDKLEEQV